MSKSLRQNPWEFSCSDCDSCESVYPCPVYKCSKHGDERITWVHGSSCGGSLRLYENGKEKCQKCGREKLFCLWDCSCYDESKNEKQYDYLQLKNMLTKLSGLDTRYCSPYFLFHIGMCIDKQYKDYKYRFGE